MVRVVMSLCQGAKVKMGAKLSEEFPVKVGVHQGSVLSSPLLFAVVADVVTESAREDLMNEILCPDDLLLMAETVEDSSENFHKWKATFESKGMKVNLGKTKVMLNGSNGEILRVRSTRLLWKESYVALVVARKVRKVDSCEMCVD